MEALAAHLNPQQPQVAQGKGVKYLKIPKISPSKYKPPKPVTQKTLR